MFSAVVQAAGRQMTVIYTSAGQFEGPDLAVGLLNMEAKFRIEAGHYLGAPAWALNPADWTKDPFVALWLLLTTFGEENVLGLGGDIPKPPAVDPLATQ